jgi:hypothetical protein
MSDDTVRKLGETISWREPREMRTHTMLGLGHRRMRSAVLRRYFTVLLPLAVIMAVVWFSARSRGVDVMNPGPAVLLIMVGSAVLAAAVFGLEWCFRACTIGVRHIHIGLVTLSPREVVSYDFSRSSLDSRAYPVLSVSTKAGEIHSISLPSNLDEEAVREAVSRFLPGTV